MCLSAQTTHWWSPTSTDSGVCVRAPFIGWLTGSSCGLRESSSHSEQSTSLGSSIREWTSFETGAETGEWRLHPKVVELLWKEFDQAEVNLFASQETTHCPLWFSLLHPALLGLDVMVQTSSQVTFIYIELLAIQIVSKQLHNIKIEK